jgi:membrane-associated phospholipid phosphatase
MIVAVAGAVARRGVPAWETRALLRINTLPDALHGPVWPVMQAGSLASVGVVSVLTLRKGHTRRATGVAVAGGAAWLVCKPLKRLVHRRRPDPESSDINIRGPVQTGLGYPSGHAAVVTAIGVVLANDATRGQVLALAGVAGVVGISRIYVGAHYPLDVVGGWAAGLVMGIFGRKLLN